MFFRNLTCYRFGQEIDLGALCDALPKHALRDCGPLELSTFGFVPPVHGFDDSYTHVVGDFKLITVAQQERLLPADVVRDVLAHKIDAIEAATGVGVGAKERKRIKDEVFTTLLPQAFVRTRRTNAYFTKDGWLVIDHATRKVAENIISSIREAAGSFPCVPLSPEESPRALMTDWVINGKLPEHLVLGDQIELRDPAETGAVVRCTNQDLESDEVREHLKSGKQVFRLALVFDDRVSFVLDEALCLHKVRFLDVVQDELGDAESTAELFDSQFALMTLELRRVLDWLASTFGVSAAPKLTLDGGDAPKHMRDAETTGKWEKVIGITAKMYEARKTAREFLGHKFDETMASSAAAITKRAKKDGTTDTEAAIALAKENHGKNAGYTSLWILAALVEMTEPSAPAASPKVHAAVKKMDRLCKEQGVTATVSDGNTGEVLASFGGGEADDLLPKAIATVREAGAVSISYVQRVFKIGYNRAAQLVETMEEQGVVSAPDHAGKRTVIQQQNTPERG
jgi:recombination associated protein RdgC